MSKAAQPKAVILGGTGHIGAAVARRFAEAGFDVSATGRRDVARPNLDGSGVTVLSGDDTDGAVLKGWIAGASVVVDCATPYPVWMHAHPAQVAISAAVARTRAVIAAVESAGARLVLISSFTTLPRANRGIWGAIGQGLRDGSHPYFDLKAAVEDHVSAYLAHGGPGAIVAPSTCFGPYDLKPRAQTFIPLLLSGEVRMLADHDLNLVDVRDVADVVLAAAGTDIKAPIPVFGHDVALRDLVRRLCALRAVPAPMVSAPKGVGTALGATGLHLFETACAIAGRSSPWPSLPALLLSASYPAARSQTQLELHPGLRPLNTTLEDAIAWYEQIGSLRL